MMRRTTVFLAAVVFVAASWDAAALSEGGPGGKWPAAWPKELEPLRKQAWTWQHADSQDVSYDIPFATRAEFEAAWPHVLKAAGGKASITLVRGPWLRVGAGKTTAGVQIRPAVGSVTQIYLVVDGDIVDLNRIPLPQGTPIIDERFKDDAAGKKDAEKRPAAPNPADANPAAEPKPVTPGR